MYSELGVDEKKHEFPFMILFYNPAKTVSEFAVRINN